jgi:hypothetical protein
MKFYLLRGSFCWGVQSLTQIPRCARELHTQFFLLPFRRHNFRLFAQLDNQIFQHQAFAGTI